jgi:L-cysteine:1D-myo-inositol 2-amino-2-deoxy-alpha-D-glucopyranoside ligase
MKLYNSLTKQKEEFKPFYENKVSLYACGITPYDTTHLGHAFTYMFFDCLVRYLKYKKYEVKYVQNVTDIDDDILKRAQKENKNWQELGKFWTDKFLTDLKNLNILLPDVYVKATDSIDSIIRIIEVLIKKGFAYEKSGNVYFDVRQFKDYGKLSGYNEEQMILISKERGADPADKNKKNPLDFILWQKSKADEPFWPIRQAQGESKGRPGWHIECSAMISQYLGEQIDIHGGGHDLIYPHHESEIAQSESFTGRIPFVKYWLHTAMVMYQGEKMSKSLGNLIMISDLLKQYSPNTIRYLLLSNYYRSPWEYTEDKIVEAEKAMMYLKKAVENKVIEFENADLSEFEKIMDDDLNAPLALQYLTDLAGKIITEKENQKKESLQNTLLSCLFILGFN